MNSIGERLKYLRKLNRLTQKQVADKTGVQRGNISHYERNNFLPSKVALISFANFFKTSYDWIVYGTGAIPKSINEVNCSDTSNSYSDNITAKVDFSKRLMFVIKYSHESVDNLCLKLNIQKDTFREIIMGKNVCAFDLLKICKYFNVSMDWMFNGDTPNINFNSEIVQAYSMGTQDNGNYKTLQYSYEEKELIVFFKNLNNRNRKLVTDILNSIDTKSIVSNQKVIK
ncbi:MULTISPECIES: helix-turn-helix domain-containing protein [Clostridium]|uniref:helix-turn-helix domain-containing protein n=1 Tax=Clostridium TaxID=1485 RepID=UPI00082507FB|nr:MULTISPECIES: helix-turn-helix transcriptional regulator [Clostridium]PJI08440.1 XRE family transcriptional regulator [Clostridium sp. CT7]